MTYKGVTFKAIVSMPHWAHKTINNISTEFDKKITYSN